MFKEPFPPGDKRNPNIQVKTSLSKFREKKVSSYPTVKAETREQGVQMGAKTLLISDFKEESVKIESKIRPTETTYTRTFPVSPRVPPARVRPGVTKNVIYCTNHHVLESYGSLMPVSVAESLNHSPDARDNASVNINPDIGWAWYVFGRRLLVWHIPSFTDTTIPLMAREMLLPSSDLSHNANLVYIFSGPNEKSPSCLAVSPEGLIRYWIELGRHKTWVDVDAKLGGEEVCGVHYIPPLGFLVVTTSATMIIVTPFFVDITITRITPASGWIGYLGKLFSSLLFGSQSQRLEMRTVKVLTNQKVKTHWHIFLLAGFTLQSWSVEIETSNSVLIYETNIEAIVQWAFPYQIRDDAENEIQISDIRHSEVDSIIVLAASDDPRYYIIVELDGNDVTPPTFAIRLSVISKQDVNFLENITGDLSSLRFLLLPAEALIFSKLIIYAVPFSGGKECDGEPLDLPGGIVLGGTMHRRIPIFFSATFGFVSITQLNTSSIDVLDMSVSETSRIPSNITEKEPITSTSMNDIINIKMAFVQFVRKNFKRCFKVIKEQFPLSKKATSVDSVLSMTLVKVSLDIINDLPSKQYQWEDETNDSNVGRKNSFQLECQLAEKLKAHDLFLEFARKLATVIDLGKVTKVNNTVKTIHVLYEHNEKLATTFILKKLEKTYEKTVKDVVIEVAHEKNFDYINIGDVEFFYRYASISDEALKRIINKCVENVGDRTTNFDAIDLLKETNDIINGVLLTLIRRRCQKGYYVDTAYLPWLSAPSPGLFDDIVALVKLNFKVIKSWVNDLYDLTTILWPFYKLCNHLLFLRMPHVPKTEFDILTSSFIHFFIEKKMYYEALGLAYKYKNFDFLASLTYQLHQEDKISDYINEFGREGFCLCLFEYLYSAQKYKDLLDLVLPEEFELQLKEFIYGKPILKFIYCLKEDYFLPAKEILENFFCDEKVSIRDQEIICLYSLILSRAAGCLNEDYTVRRLLKTIQLQRSIPEELFIQNGYDPESIKLLSHEEIIDVYAGSELNENKELYFFKSLEIIDLMDDPTAKEFMRMNIWATVISQDPWKGVELDFPAEIFEDFVTFRLMKLLKFNCKVGSTFKVPTIDEIVLGELFENDKRVDVLRKSLQSRRIYLYWYEQIVDLDESSSFTLSNSYDADGEESDETIYIDCEDESSCSFSSFSSSISSTQ